MDGVLLLPAFYVKNKLAPGYCREGTTGHHTHLPGLWWQLGGLGVVTSTGNLLGAPSVQNLGLPPAPGSLVWGQLGVSG